MPRENDGGIDLDKASSQVGLDPDFEKMEPLQTVGRFTSMFESAIEIVAPILTSGADEWLGKLVPLSDKSPNPHGENLTPVLAMMLRRDNLSALCDNSHARDALKDDKEITDIIHFLEHLKIPDLVESIEFTVFLRSIGFLALNHEQLNLKEIRQLFYMLTPRFIAVFEEFCKNPKFVPSPSTLFTDRIRKQAQKFTPLSSEQKELLFEHLQVVAVRCKAKIGTPTDMAKSYYRSFTREYF